jgi:hypothetical protein
MAGAKPASRRIDQSADSTIQRFNDSAIQRFPTELPDVEFELPPATPVD